MSNTKNFTSSFLKVLNGHSVRLANAEEEARRGRDQIQKKKKNWLENQPEVGFLNILCLFHTTFQPNEGIKW